MSGEFRTPDNGNGNGTQLKRWLRVLRGNTVLTQLELSVSSLMESQQQLLELESGRPTPLVELFLELVELRGLRSLTVAGPEHLFAPVVLPRSLSRLHDPTHINLHVFLDTNKYHWFLTMFASLRGLQSLDLLVVKHSEMPVAFGADFAFSMYARPVNLVQSTSLVLGQFQLLNNVFSGCAALLRMVSFLCKLDLTGMVLKFI